jgi:hypothetical protein
MPKARKLALDNVSFALREQPRHLCYMRKPPDRTPAIIKTPAT